VSEYPPGLVITMVPLTGTGLRNFTVKEKVAVAPEIFEL
jgi:hypothetical protein